MYPCELVETFRNRLRIHPHKVCDSYRSQCIVDIVLSWNPQACFTKWDTFFQDSETFTGTLGIRDIYCAVVIALFKTEGQELLGWDSLDCLAGVDIVAVYHKQAGSLKGKLVERANDIFQSFKIIQMVCVDI